MPLQLLVGSRGSLESLLVGQVGVGSSDHLHVEQPRVCGGSLLGSAGLGRSSLLRAFRLALLTLVNAAVDGHSFLGR